MSLPLWLDCDPGHDDAIALLLALHTPNLRLLGVSACHGNAPLQATYHNAARLLYAFAAPNTIPLYKGASRPLIKEAMAAQAIHGESGLDGVKGLPEHTHPKVREWMKLEGKNAIVEMYNILKKQETKTTMIITGPCTNVALLVATFPDVLQNIDKIVIMGGGVGIGNISPVAEFNAYCDPDALQMILDCGAQTVLIPLNVTHTAIFTTECLTEMKQKPSSMQHTIETLLGFFADTYRDTFNFVTGPPLHDALTVAYLARPDLFSGAWRKVHVVREGVCLGQTIVDPYRVSDGTIWVADKLKVVEFWNEVFFPAVRKADAVSPLNIMSLVPE